MANRTRPSLACHVEIVEMDGLPVLVIEVPTSRMPVSTPEGKYQRRAIGGKGKPECMPYFFPEMIARQADRGIQDYSALVVPDARWEDLDPLEFESDTTFCVVASRILQVVAVDNRSMTGFMMSGFWKCGIYDLTYVKFIKDPCQYPKILDSICCDIHTTSFM